ncbi:GNAT family N-acetyltransferase [Inquilinus limosus]|uniref:GNAT family N-acetyltransferase n=1 Tax=Inquilinus limosus TaxID=171674 RepID=UPI00041C92FB|nr:GNAT family N-acetyltransferase [Inquilinus limosus]
MPDPIVPVETERLLLRRFTPEDFEAFHGYHRLPEVARYLYRNPRTPEQSRAALERIGTLKFEGEGDELVLAVEARDGGALLGEVLLKWVSREARQAEIGYIFAPEAGGRGYATEAARAMLALGFGRFGFHRIFARCDALNAGSINVLRRLGMRQEAHLIQNDRFNGVWGDELIFAMLQEEWARRVSG